MLVTDKGKLIRCPVDDEAGRQTQGSDIVHVLMMKNISMEEL